MREQAKEALEAAGFKGQTVVLGGATIAGFVAAAFSLPFDFVKTRIQKMQPNPDGSYPYKGPLDCAVKTFTQEGPLKFYTGFPTYCIRCASCEEARWHTFDANVLLGCVLLVENVKDAWLGRIVSQDDAGNAGLPLMQP